MKFQVVGRLRQDYDLSAQNGPKFHGVKYYGIDLDQQQEGLEGNICTDIKIPDGSSFALSPLEVGRVYVVYFNQKKGVDYIRPDDGAQSSFGVYDHLGEEVV